MSISTITSKGQTTIPQDIRNYLSLETGDQIEFVIESDGQVILVPLTSHVMELKGMLPKPRKKVSIEQMNKTIIKRGSKR